MQQALAGAEVSGTRSSRDAGQRPPLRRAAGRSADGIQGAVRITYPPSVIDDQIRHIWLLLAATGGVVLGIVFLVSLLLARSMTKPLADLEDAAGALGAGDLVARAEVPKGPAELTVLAESFNATAARLEQLVRRAARRSSPTRRTSCARRSRRCGCGSRTSRPTCTAPPPKTSRARSTEVRGCRGSSTACSCSRGPSSRRRRRRRSSVDDVHRRPVRRVGRVRGREARAHRRRRSAGTPVASRDAGPARAGRRQPPEQRARGRARRAARCASSPRELRRLGRAAGQRRGPGHVGRGARPRVRPLLAVGRGPARRSPQRSLRPRALDRARARRGRRRRRRARRRRRRRRPRGGGADAAERTTRCAPRAASALDGLRRP